MRIYLYCFLLLSLVWPSSIALANEDCQTASTSADVMRCLTHNHEKAQETLNQVFRALSTKKSGEALKDIETLQKLWIEYRDQECAAEVEALSTEALKRIEGLKCQARLTRERITAIQRTVASETGSPTLGEPPNAQQPRWINALAEQYQDVYWQYGGTHNGDLDCDGDDEFVLSGIVFNEEVSDYETVLAISENPHTGKPQNTLLNLITGVAKISEQSPDGQLRCSGVVVFSFNAEEQPAEEEVAADSEGEADPVEPVVVAEGCNKRLVVERKIRDQGAQCPPVTVYWNGENYVFNE